LKLSRNILKFKAENKKRQRYDYSIGIVLEMRFDFSRIEFSYFTPKRTSNLEGQICPPFANFWKRKSMEYAWQ